MSRFLRILLAACASVSFFVAGCAAKQEASAPPVPGETKTATATSPAKGTMTAGARRGKRSPAP